MQKEYLSAAAEVLSDHGVGWETSKEKSFL